MSYRAWEPNALGTIVPPFGGGSGGGGGPSPGGGASTFEWNANGLLAGFFPQGATFNGMLVSNAALAGDGPFDGQRVAELARTITFLVVSQRVPSNLVENTVIEFYRIRAGTVTSLGTVILNNTAQFQRVAPAPAVSDVAVGDILFVSLNKGVLGATAEDLSAYLEFA